MTRLTQNVITEYTRKGYWSDKVTTDYFEKLVRKHDDRELVVDGDKRFTLGQIDSMADTLAANLQELGIKKGDVVSVELPNWYQSLVIYLATAKIGCIINPIVHIYRDKEVFFILKQARSAAFIIPNQFSHFDYAAMAERLKPDLSELKWVLVVGENVPRGMLSLDELINVPVRKKPRQENTDANEVRVLNYTSGTTAQPKGVQHTHNTILSCVATMRSFHRLSPNDIVFMPNPLTHIVGVLYGLEMPLVMGCKLVLQDTWNPEIAIKLVEKERCTFMLAATPFLQHMLDSPSIKEHDVSSLTRFICGGASVPPQLIERAGREIGWPAMRCYGSTEALTVSFGIPSGGSGVKAARTDGKIAGYEVKIVDNTRKELAIGEEGEIALRGPALFVGYLNEKLNEDCFDEVGFFYTGDLGRIDDDGYLEITGRLKDIIIRGGENISVSEVEELLHSHPSISETACVAMPDLKMGEKVCAYVKHREGKSINFEEMSDFLVHSGLSKRKLPERLEIINEFPRTAAGKIIKTELRKDIAKKLSLPPVRI